MPDAAAQPAPSATASWASWLSGVSSADAVSIDPPITQANLDCAPDLTAPVRALPILLGRLLF
jgi:hypothetical protein